MASRLKINHHKCNLRMVGVSFEEIENMATITGCEPMKFPFDYLGMHAWDNMAKVKGWNTIFEMSRSKLSKWKANMLSIDGISMLPTSVLGSL